MPAAMAAKTTQQKIDEFYGVRQLGTDVVFAARFEKAKQVLIAGDFNAWSGFSTPMQSRGEAGEWTMTLPLRPGRYRYRFVVDGKWVTDPFNARVERNQYGELDNVVEVK
jgi:1,4-alpha-glucan branching enzyme